uniref:SH2 domain-containing protein n=1 Tax=Amphimedon queenslandica TaxID=400682 RepID=A0A1X7SVP6_AMPQE
MAEMSNQPFVSSASPRATSVSRSSESSTAYLSDPMMKMKWFHPFLTRHSAECMLIDNAPEGSYLLRPSATGGKDQYTLSVKFSQSVQHMKVKRLPDSRYQFGRSFFENVNALKKHFELERPIVGGESGITVVLSYPYSREVDEQHLYTEVHHHAVTRMVNNAVVEESDSDSYDLPDTDSSPELDSLHRRLQQITPVASREGYLTKLGKIKKNWKVRWFVLRNTTLSYYKTKQ